MPSFFDDILSDSVFPTVSAVHGIEIVYHREENGAPATGFPKTITAECESIKSAREDYPDELVSDKLEMTVVVSESDVDPQVETDYIVLDGEEWTVVEVLRKLHGRVRVRTELMGLVRRGGREIQR